MTAALQRALGSSVIPGKLGFPDFFLVFFYEILYALNWALLLGVKVPYRLRIGRFPTWLLWDVKIGLNGKLFVVFQNVRKTRIFTPFTYVFRGFSFSTKNTFHIQYHLFSVICRISF